MSAHRYWRCINITRAGGDGELVSCGELQFRTSVGGSQAAVGGVAIGSSYYTYPPYDTNPLLPSKAFDGANAVTADIWHIDKFASSLLGYRDQWIGYDFGFPVEIVEVAVALRADGYGQLQAWRSCSVEVSDDGTRWVLYSPATGFNAGAGDYTLKAAQISEVLAFSAPLKASTVCNNSLALVPGPLPQMSRRVDKSWSNIYYGGTTTVQGTVTVENIPGARRVRLFEKCTGILVAETWSDPSGHYEFDHVKAGVEYFVVSHDHTRTYNAVIQDMVTP